MCKTFSVLSNHFQNRFSSILTYVIKNKRVTDDVMSGMLSHSASKKNETDQYVMCKTFLVVISN